MERYSEVMDWKNIVSVPGELRQFTDPMQFL